MQSFTHFLVESMADDLSKNFNLMQYLFLRVSKAKNVKRAAGAVTKFVSGSQNWALGGQMPEFTTDTLIDAYYKYRAEEWKKQRDKTPAEKHDAALNAFVSYFFLDRNTLQRYL